MAGYSKRSLVDKLGIKPGASVLILEAPKGHDKTLGTLPFWLAAGGSLPRADSAF